MATQEVEILAIFVWTLLPGITFVIGVFWCLWLAWGPKKQDRKPWREN